MKGLSQQPKLEESKPAMPVRGLHDAAVAEITKNPQYLTDENIRALRAVIQDEQELVDPSTNQSSISLAGLLSNLVKTQKRFETMVATSKDPDDVRKLVVSMKQIIEMVIKHQDAANEQAKAVHIQNAVLATFDALGNPELKAEFLKKLRHFLQ